MEQQNRRLDASYSPVREREKIGGFYYYGDGDKLDEWTKLQVALSEHRVMRALLAENDLYYTIIYPDSGDDLPTLHLECALCQRVCEEHQRESVDRLTYAQWMQTSLRALFAEYMFKWMGKLPETWSQPALF